ncbi:DMT family transporter [Bacillus sp. UNC438CL73TsuS30]|uniref:DMT family transporter n=1 Tax=Bacillus sp. UNC438CL73TsuS30 TaxID=1340434 RepID=UPI00047B3320|nr:DMT family transporter [Bacillus sp. UNC438CL73TsuS30]
MPIFYVFLLLLTSLLWGGNFVFGKFLVGHASPMTITTLRWMIAILVLLPIVLKQEKKLIPPKSSIIPLLFMGLTGVVFFNLFQFLALEKTSATNVGLISSLNPISIAIFSSYLLKEKLKILQIFSMGVSLLGVLMVLARGEFSHLLSLHFNIGDLWMIAAVIIWGLYSICSKWVMKKMSPMLATFYSGVFGLVILIPFNISSFQISNLNSSFLWAILYTGVISTVVCMVLWNIGVQKIGATSSGIFLNFNPIFTSILAYFFLDERMSWSELGGSVIVIAGCFLFSWLRSGMNGKSTKVQVKFGS